jgi:hypothetical protein
VPSEEKPPIARQRYAISSIPNPRLEKPLPKAIGEEE